ncbi:putative E3 ubiquitin-protein ligase DTX2-like [Hyalella azteca]|uniref:E3 ubiquitin-protein ligase n=1 Tax=Hyalella azteca TaxID=294128 RepID=A0A6A0H598_HYAAZ|nr:uncharacterized protein LOC108677892 [Hyalella azteca]KAA0198941.1 putative E3 ubiquitin-protein ligase DTX2-like [Hyalella azteca]
MSNGNNDKLSGDENGRFGRSNNFEKEDSKSRVRTEIDVNMRTLGIKASVTIDNNSFSLRRSSSREGEGPSNPVNRRYASAGDGHSQNFQRSNHEPSVPSSERSDVEKTKLYRTRAFAGKDNHSNASLSSRSQGFEESFQISINESGARSKSKACFKPAANVEPSNSEYSQLENGLFLLNGVEYTQEELDFLLENSLPQCKPQPQVNLASRQPSATDIAPSRKRHNPPKESYNERPAIASQKVDMSAGESSLGLDVREDLVHTLGDVKKLGNDIYDIGGLMLSKKEFEFIMNQSGPDVCSTTSRGSFLGATSSPRTYEETSNDSSYGESTHKNFVAYQQIFRKQPSTAAEKLLAASSQELEVSPYLGEELAKCPVCLGGLSEASPQQDRASTSRGLVGAVMLANCGHCFHCCCLLPLLLTAAQSFSCPVCRTLHGAVTGTQPVGGRMSSRVENFSLPGFPSSDTIVILYEIPEGVQGPEHPHPGQPYHLNGFPRKAYLPDTHKGNKVLALLKTAFERRLVFTVGYSATSLQPDCVIWGGISHKTLVKDAKFGYPDDKYLDTVLMELAALCVA